MTTNALLETARQRRLDALASLSAPRQHHHSEHIVSLFDDVFDETAPVMSQNVIAFRPAAALVAATRETAASDRVAA